MINEKTVLAVIPARGGSKGLPRKNILPLVGKPLIAWSIEAAHESKYIDKCIVSTDDKEIAGVAKKHGCEVPFMRSAELSTDDANSNNVFLHALDMLENQYDIVMVLQPTSPLRKTEDIDTALELMLNQNKPALVSVCEASKPLQWHRTINKDGTLEPVFSRDASLTNRQDQSLTYVPNGALFIAETEFFKKEKTFYTESTLAYVMPPDRSVDIDNQIDFLVTEALVS